MATFPLHSRAIQLRLDASDVRLTQDTSIAAAHTGFARRGLQPATWLAVNRVLQPAIYMGQFVPQQPQSAVEERCGKTVHIDVSLMPSGM